MNKTKMIVGIAVVAMGVSEGAATQKFTEEELAYMPATAHVPTDIAAALSKTLPQNYRDGRFPDFRNRK